MNNFIDGFVKRAMLRGLSKEQAIEILKLGSSLPIPGAVGELGKPFSINPVKAPTFPKIPGSK